MGAIYLGGLDSPQHVTIRNREISWEPFFACVVGSESVYCEPDRGVLAPRGGANNVCDTSKPYSDSCTLKIGQKPATWAGGGSTQAPPRGGAGGSPTCSVVGACHLVVKIEQSTQTWSVFDAEARGSATGPRG